MKLIKLTFILFILNSCQENTGTKTKVNHVIIKKFKVPPVGVHEEISPRYRAVLENGDTVPTSQNSKPGDTVRYFYYNMK
jgi:hypothetical protein